MVCGEAVEAVYTEVLFTARPSSTDEADEAVSPSILIINTQREQQQQRIATINRSQRADSMHASHDVTAGTRCLAGLDPY